MHSHRQKLTKGRSASRASNCGKYWVCTNETNQNQQARLASWCHRVRWGAFRGFHGPHTQKPFHATGSFLHFEQPYQDMDNRYHFYTPMSLEWCTLSFVPSCLDRQPNTEHCFHSAIGVRSWGKKTIREGNCLLYQVISYPHSPSKLLFHWESIHISHYSISWPSLYPWKFSAAHISLN